MGDEENIGKIGGAIGIENGNTGEARKWCGVVTSSYGRIAGHHRLRETHLLGRFILHACFRQANRLPCTNFVLKDYYTYAYWNCREKTKFAEGSKDVGASRIIGIDIDNKKIDVGVAYILAIMFISAFYSPPLLVFDSPLPLATAASKVPTVAAWTTSSRVMLFPATTASKVLSGEAIDTAKALAFKELK
ncbi:hypothetical protein Zm00014a_035957 [Zea mays]|uniref:Uncharacterized protein n=1 Tax=Zea mays TaxID=4577 RepID=A0A3L6EDH8_MAIZE|nr:hypothetical protein Zm00014a_035957 [Zea mays]